VSLATIALIAGTTWIALLILVVAMCKVARRADANSDRIHAAIR
jgi:hypothetical protein